MAKASKSKASSSAMAKVKAAAKAKTVQRGKLPKKIAKKPAAGPEIELGGKPGQADPKTMTGEEWEKLSAEEKQKQLALMGPCNRNLYNAFHKSMASGGKNIPEHFKNEYERIMQLKGKRGVSTNKMADLRNLCRQWWMAAKDEKGNISKVKWDSAFIQQSCWAKSETIMTEKEESYTWGQIVGMFFGETLAIAALKRGEIEARDIQDSRGKKHKRFVVINFSGVGLGVRI